jgi:diguanylate cyclase (GGDEF)-like protein/PAS domain S-box-containing protein
MPPRHRLLERQLRKHFAGAPGPDLGRLLEAVSDAYQQQDESRQRVERAMELSSSELLERNRDLAGAQDRLLAEVQQRKRSEYRYSLAAQGANDGLWDWDVAAGRVYYSRRWKEMLGYEEAEIGDGLAEWMERVHADDLARLQADVDALLGRQLENLSSEFRVRHRDGQYRWVLCRGIAVKDPERDTVRAAGSLTNITDRKLAEEQLRFEAMHDSLTGLANRSLLADRLSHTLARNNRDPKHRFALLYIDLDEFKVINDSLGHQIGDKLLIEVSRRLIACARKVDTIARIPGDHVARIGGDEFVMLLEDLASPEDALRVADRIHAALAEPFSLGGNDLVARGSIGIATSDAGYGRPEEVLRDADTALYQAKLAGKSCTCMFDPQMHQRAMARWSTETELRRAIDRDEFELHYQPIVDGDGRLAALEALVRWRHPARGLVMPNDFISIAEETGLIVPLGKLVLAKACRQLRRWQREAPSLGQLAVGVNISYRQFVSPAVVDDVARILDETGLAPRSLRLEVTESTAMQNAAQTIETMARLRAMGVLIYMDDFGTGYSSLSQLQRMPLDALKIDREFVKEMGPDATGSSIVDSIIALGHTMNLRVIAEGVETAEQAARLALAGCDYLQGYHRPPAARRSAGPLRRRAPGPRRPARAGGLGRSESAGDHFGRALILPILYSPPERSSWDEWGACSSYPHPLAGRHGS